MTGEGTGLPGGGTTAIATPTIKGRLRLRPPDPILRARSILYSIPIIVFGVAGTWLILSVVLRADPKLVIPSVGPTGITLPPIWPGYVVGAVAYLATRGFRDRRLWSFGLAILVAVALLGAALLLVLSTLSAGPTSEPGEAAGPVASAVTASPIASAAAAPSPGASAGASAVPRPLTNAEKEHGNAVFATDALAFFFAVLGLPLLWNLFRGRAWFLDREETHPILTAEHLEEQTVAISEIIAGAADAGAATGLQKGEPLVSVRGLKKHFPITGGVLRRRIGTIYAVDGVDFDVLQGEVFSVVGESGCGKTTLGRTLLQLTPPTDGRVIYDGYELADVDPDDMRPLRRRMQIIFQDPFGSLNPRMPISDIIGEGLLAQGVTNRAERDKRVGDSLEAVGLRRDYTRRYPHEFSGGQRQRIGIARALALSPDFIVCDEPVSALDVSIQSQVLNLLLDLKRDFDLTYMFISHNLSVVEYFSDRIAVMYLGRIVEIGSVDELYRNARHPYTIALLSAIPVPDPRKRRRRLVLKGDVPSPAAPPAGCRFHTRCWLYEQLGKPERCTTDDPSLRVIEGTGHQVACHFAEEISETAVREQVANQDVIETAAAEV
jgi:oligopeptide transport system ATP-binding protein